ncbi:MAG: hypothetical protein KatS3mg131_2671 [Candidatus Tectimicrobiota bacterium]|nr:MAG: hypothetical protein KatS3mg131_2671 [Candidatus Tectomicrobia bacterium]
MSNKHAPAEGQPEPVETYAGGEITARHGAINKWLLLVYAALFLWALYYALGPFDGLRPTFAYWGGLGPGLVREATGALGGPGAVAFVLFTLGVVAFFVWVAVLACKK